MAFADDLLDQADRMLSITNPTEADVRCAISNAYYGLFHFLIDNALELFCPVRPPNLRNIVRRGFDHKVMRDLCTWVARGGTANLAAKVRPAFSDPLEPELIEVAKAFVSLQQQRHSADYALHEPISWISAASAVNLVRTAVAGFNAIGHTDNVQAFLMSLLLHDQWRAE